MNLLAQVELYAGGPGSGCNPEAAEKAGNKCGRPAAGSTYGNFREVEMVPHQHFGSYPNVFFADVHRWRGSGQRDIGGRFVQTYVEMYQQPGERSTSDPEKWAVPPEFVVYERNYGEKESREYSKVVKERRFDTAEDAHAYLKSEYAISTDVRPAAERVTSKRGRPAFVPAKTSSPEHPLKGKFEQKDQEHWGGRVKTTYSDPAGRLKLEVLDFDREDRVKVWSTKSGGEQKTVYDGGKTKGWLFLDSRYGIRYNRPKTIRAGGPGSGCNPEKGRCGRRKKVQSGPRWGDDRHLEKQRAAGLAWAERQLKVLARRGWPQDEVEHHILAFLGRKYNIGVQRYVMDTLKLKMKDYFGEEPEEDDDDIDSSITAGGAGSGCNPEKGRCGRHADSRISEAEQLADELRRHGSESSTHADAWRFIWKFVAWVKKNTPKGEKARRAVLRVANAIRKENPQQALAYANAALRLWDIAAASVYAGGPGSGCDPKSAAKRGKKCGRPKTQTQTVDTARVAELKKELEDINEELSGRVAKARKQRLTVIRDSLVREIAREAKPPAAVDPETTFTPREGEIAPLSVSKRMTSSSHVTPDGVRYTLIKPKERRDRSMTVERPQMSHYLKGRFEKHKTFHSKIVPGLDTTLFEAARPQGKQGEGSALLVYRYKGEQKRFVIQEFTLGEYAYLQRTRVFRFKNIPQGMTWLKRRYGASLYGKTGQ